MKKGIWKLCSLFLIRVFPDGSSGKESACNAGDTGDGDLIAGSGRSLGKEMATHCSVLAWKTQWTEEPGGLQSMGLQRVRHDWARTCVSNKYIQFCSWHREELTFVELDLGHSNLRFSKFKAINSVNVYWPLGLKRAWMKAQPLRHRGDGQRWQAFQRVGLGESLGGFLERTIPRPRLPGWFSVGGADRKEGHSRQKDRQVRAWCLLYNGAEETGVGVGRWAWRSRSGHERPFKLSPSLEMIWKSIAIKPDCTEHLLGVFFFKVCYDFYFPTMTRLIQHNLQIQLPSTNCILSYTSQYCTIPIFDN